MRIGILAGILGILAALGLGAAFAYQNDKFNQRPSAGSTVMVLVGGGHASGVHIGGGLIVTAAHVTDGAKSVEIKTDRGGTETAEVVWEHPEVDLALLKTARVHAITASPIRCRPNYIGQRLKLHGNPKFFDFVVSPAVVIGTTASAMGKDAVLPVSGTAAPGMSGGPALDMNGRVVGIVSAMLTTSPSFLAIVPATAICKIMGVK
jgi:serine protease Do